MNKKLHNLTVVMLLTIANYIHAQNTDSIQNISIAITTKYVTDSGYVLDQDTIMQRFSILEKQQETYQLQIVNAGISTIAKQDHSEWHIIDSFIVNCVVADSSELLLPRLTISDFNKDGYNDLLCLMGTNINGNEWMYLFLYNAKLQRLEKLMNSAEVHWQNNYSVWDNPTYNINKQTIDCVLWGGAYGIDLESSYKLIDNTAIPLTKTEENRTNGTITTRQFIGIDGKWKYKSMKKE